MITGYAVTINPMKNSTTWAGMVSNFEINFSGLDVATSTFTLLDFDGNTDDILIFNLLDGAGDLVPDNRTDSTVTPAYYYGVITSINDDEVTTSDLKYYLNTDYVPDNTSLRIAQYEDGPLGYLAYISSLWTVLSPMFIKQLSRVAYTGKSFTFPKPSSAESTSLLEYIEECFKLYQIVPVVYADMGAKSGALKVDGDSNAPYQILYATFISGGSAGTVFIDESNWCINPDVYVRPTMNGEPNGINICIPINMSSGKYIGIRYIYRRYITEDGEITDVATGDKVIKPIKMKTVVYTQSSESTNGSNQ